MLLRLMTALLLFAPQQRPGRGPGAGEYRGELRDKQGPLMRVAMWAPDKAPPSPVRAMALLLVFHGMNGNEGNYYGGTLEALRRNKLEQQYVMIAGKSKGPGWTIEDDGPIVKRVIEWAKETWPIDPRRIYLWGSSNGAGFVGRFGWANQDLVAAVVGYCGSYQFKGEKREADDGLEWYFVHGGNDNPQNSANACKQLKELGYRYVFRQLDGYGHTDIWDGNGHPDRTVVDACRDDYLQWLDALRHKTLPPPRKDLDFLARFEKSADSLLGSKATYLHLARIGGPQAGAAILRGLESKSAGIRAAAADACLTSSFGRPVCLALAKLAADENDRVRHSALRALGAYANWHYPEAIDALCAVAAPPAGAPKPGLGARLMAVEGLARAAKLARLGNFEDRSLWWTLVDLLEDEEARIRTAAYEALRPAVKDGFGYVPGRIPEQRKEAVARWKAWVTQKCGARN